MSWMKKIAHAPAQAPQAQAQAPAAQPAQSSVAEKFRQLETALNAKFVGREREAKALVIGLASGEPVYWEGPPGTTKTTMVEALAEMVNGKFFYYAMHEHAEPDEVIGPVDIVKLREKGELDRITTGYLPDADIVMLDEIYRASGAMLNMLIDIILNKRVRIGARIVKLPTVAMYFAANFRRAEEEFVAFHDRLTIRIFSEYINDRQKLAELVKRGLELLQEKAAGSLAGQPLLTVDEVRMFQQKAQLMAINVVSNLVDKIAELVQHARSSNIPVSDRRAVKLAYITAVIAMLDGRSIADTNDLADAARLVLPLEAGDVEKVEQIIEAMGLDTLRELRQKLSQLIDEAKRLSSMILDAYSKQLRGEELPAELSDVVEAFRRTASELEATLQKVKANGKAQQLIQQYLPRLRETLELMKRAEPFARELAQRL